MPDFRVFTPHATADAREITLAAAESHHLVAVNRCGEGDPVVAFDGRGREWICACRTASKSSAILAVRESRQADALLPAISLAQSIPKGSTMDEIVRQATELGATRVIPLLSERTQVHFDDGRSDKKVEKWRTAAIEAAKQCGNPWLPEIAPVQKLSQVLQQSAPCDIKLVASLHAGARSIRETLHGYEQANGRPARTVMWLIGPEGDFSPAEMSAITAAGFVPVSLGPLVLRCDTAAVFALSATRVLV
jgi:16S rRNA (uracil1498-N3)-methyltransferase